MEGNDIHGKGALRMEPYNVGTDGGMLRHAQHAAAVGRAEFESGESVSRQFGIQSDRVRCAQESRHSAICSVSDLSRTYFIGNNLKGIISVFRLQRRGRDSKIGRPNDRMEDGDK